MRTKPNLFDYASSELSQDAFLCWLLAWLAPEFEGQNDDIRNVAEKLLDAFFEAGGETPPREIRSLKIDRQVGKIDILVCINESIYLLIEDKTETGERLGQLDAYLAYLKSRFQPGLIVPIYLKTGDQSSYQSVRDSGFHLFLREKLLSVLSSGAAVDNDIYQDFLCRLQEKEDEFNSYKTLPVARWKPRAWQGFYTKLQDRMGKGGWGYVSNPQGGFWGYWWIPEDDAQASYLQFEQEKLCVKVNAARQKNHASSVEDFRNKIVSLGQERGIEFHKQKLRRGNTMTVACLQDDFWHQKKDGSLDIDGTIDRLHMIEAIIGEAA